MYGSYQAGNPGGDSTSSGVPESSVPFQPTQDMPKADLFGTLESESVNAAALPASAVTAAEGEDDGNGESWVQCFDEESGWPYVYNQATGEMKWVEPESTEQLLAVLWDVCYDQDGNQFYYNPVGDFIYVSSVAIYKRWC